MFEFSIPAESAPRSPRPIAVSVVGHVLAILLLFTLRFSAGVSSFSARQHITLIAPLTETPIEPTVQGPHPKQFRPDPQRPNLQTPAVAAISAPALELPKPPAPEIPRSAPAPPLASTIKPANEFAEVLKPPIILPKPQIKEAGFGAETTVKIEARRERSSVGAFDSAHAIEEGTAHTTAATRPGGFADASAQTSTAARRGAIASAAFGDTTVEKGLPASRPLPAARVIPAEIVFKPKPAYSEEARAKKIEGEVLLEIEFCASGESRVLSLMRGLGYGLDENAIAAARAIRFRPATRDGGPVDSAAVVHIVFQLAN